MVVHMRRAWDSMVEPVGERNGRNCPSPKLKTKGLKRGFKEIDWEKEGVRSPVRRQLQTLKEEAATLIAKES